MTAKSAKSGRGPSTGWPWVLDRDSPAAQKLPFIEQFNFSRLSSSKYLPPHKNKGYEFHYSDRGRFEFTIGRRTVTMGSGQAMMTCPWQEHSARGYRLGPGRIAWLILTPELATPGGRLKLGPWCHMPPAEQNKLGKGLAESVPLLISDQSECRRILFDLRRELTEQPPFFVRRVEGLVVDLLLLAYRSARGSASRQKEIPAPVVGALDAMARDVQRPWTIDELCSLAELSKPALVKWVKAATGYTPMNYLLKLRIDKGCSRLSETDDSITTIALDLGFNSSAHFSSSFRKFLLMSPRSYRRMGASKLLDPETFQNEWAVREVMQWLSNNPGMSLASIKKQARSSSWPAFERTFARIVGTTFARYRASLRK